MKPESLFVEGDRLRLHVSCWGDPEAPVLFLLHGMRDHSRSWDWIAADFARDHRVYAPDLRGHGDSGWASPGAYALSSLVLDLDDVVRATGVERFALVGHSFGGAVALRYTAAFPEKVRGYAGIECVELPNLREYRARPVPYPGQLRNWIDRQHDARTRAPRSYPSLEAAAARLAKENPELSADTVAHLTRHGMVADGAGGWRWKYDPAARQRAPEDADGRDIDELLDALACPVMLAYGTASWVPKPPAERLARIRDLTLVDFPGATHSLHHTERAAYATAVRAFLSQLPER